MRTPWASDGKNFSQRIWKDRTQLVNNLQKNLSESCRSTTAPVVDEDFLTSRRAKNPKTGEYDEIPPDMNYKQWKEKYVEGKENAEKVKAETQKGTGSSGGLNNSLLRGAEMEVPPKEINAPEGETVYTNTDLQSFREKYDNQVKETAQDNLDKEISKELKNNIKSNIKANEKLHESYHIFGKEGTELAEVHEINSNEFIVEKEDDTVDWDYIFKSESFKKDCAQIPNCIYDLLFECGLIKDEKEEFLSKFNNNEENLNFVDKMIEYGRKIIKDNAGKNIEISFVIGSSGENLKLKDEDFYQSTEEHRNHLTVEQIFKIRNLNIRVNQGKGEFPFLVHNHTTDKPPSPEDFKKTDGNSRLLVSEMKVRYFF